MKSNAPVEEPKLGIHRMNERIRMLDHWHPVLPSGKLGRKPVGIKLCGQEIVLFRTKQGLVGALFGSLSSSPDAFE